MFENKTANTTDNSAFFDLNRDVRNDTMVLNEIVDFALDEQNNSMKVMEALSILHDGQNILMILLQERKFDLINQLLEISHIILSNSKILLQKDTNGQDILGYFIEFASYEMIEKFLDLIKEHCSPEEIKNLVHQKRNDGKTHLMLIAQNQKFEGHENIFKMMVDLIATTCGLNEMSDALSVIDHQGNNVLMLSLKSGCHKISVKILDLIEKTVPDITERKNIQYKLVSQVNSESENLLIALIQNYNEDMMNLARQILKIIQHSDPELITVTQQNRDCNNSIMLCMILKNHFIVAEILSLIQALQSPHIELFFSTISEQYNQNNDNFISLALKNSQDSLYLGMIFKFEESIAHDVILKLFSKTFELHRNLMHEALLSSNLNTVLSIMKYVKLFKAISGNEKQGIAEMLMRHDSTNTSLILHTIQNGNPEVCNLILDTAKEFCNPIDIKFMLNVRDAHGKTAYMLAYDNSKLRKIIENFARDTSNEEYIHVQAREMQMMQKQQSKSILQLAVKVFHE